MPSPLSLVGDSDFEKRRAFLFSLGIPEEIYGAGALLTLAAGGEGAAANVELRRVAEWFLHPHPHGRDLQGEPDFAAIKLCRAWHRFQSGSLEPETREAIRRFFLRHNFASIYQSENHALLFHTARYLMATVWPEETFTAYRRKGAVLRQEDEVWLQRFIRYRAGHGWGEFDSPCYLAPVWECLTCLFDFSPKRELRRLAGSMLDLSLADFQVDSLQGNYGGAHGRIYPPQALDHAAEGTRLLHYLYFGGEAPTADRMNGFIIDPLTSSYRPSPAVAGLAVNRQRPYENRERKHLHNVADVLPEEPLDGSIRKYTYWTPDFVLGCVQFQDAYPVGNCPCHAHEREVAVPPDQRISESYAHHQQHEWDLSFGTRSDARIFTHHPGTNPQHNHWTGDWLCGCGHFFQNKSALVALYDIAPGQVFQSIHAYVPKSAFDEIIEEHEFVFARAGAAYGALRVVAGYRWTQEGEGKDREIVAEGPRQAVICEAGRESDFGNFAAFRKEIAANPIRFNAERMELEYHSRRAGHLRIDTRGGRWIDGKMADLDYPAYDSPWLRAPWGAERIEVEAGEGQTPLVLDFSEVEQ